MIPSVLDRSVAPPISRAVAAAAVAAGVARDELPASVVQAGVV